jgi:hypothetical protein
MLAVVDVTTTSVASQEFGARTPARQPLLALWAHLKSSNWLFRL